MNRERSAIVKRLSYKWDDNPDIEAIKIGLNVEDHHDDVFVKHLYLHTPLLQEPPEDLDETWRHGILLSGGGRHEYLELARNYRHVAESTLQAALERSDVDGLHLVEKRHRVKLPPPIREWILELEKIDPAGTAFRYADPQAGSNPYAGHWFDFRHFEFAMKRVFDALDMAILRVGAKGNPVDKRK